MSRTMRMQPPLPLLDPLAEQAAVRIAKTKLNPNRFIRTVLRLVADGKPDEAQHHAVFALECPRTALLSISGE